jgi:hypothetical protein
MRFSRLERRTAYEQLCRTTIRLVSVSSFLTSLSQSCTPANKLKIRRGRIGNNEPVRTKKRAVPAKADT